MHLNILPLKPMITHSNLTLVILLPLQSSSRLHVFFFHTRLSVWFQVIVLSLSQCFGAPVTGLLPFIFVSLSLRYSSFRIFLHTTHVTISVSYTSQWFNSMSSIFIGLLQACHSSSHLSISLPVYFLVQMFTSIHFFVNYINVILPSFSQFNLGRRFLFFFHNWLSAIFSSTQWIYRSSISLIIVSWFVLHFFFLLSSTFCWKLFLHKSIIFQRDKPTTRPSRAGLSLWMRLDGFLSE